MHSESFFNANLNLESLGNFAKKLKRKKQAPLAPKLISISSIKKHLQFMDFFLAFQLFPTVSSTVVIWGTHRQTPLLTKSSLKKSSSKRPVDFLLHIEFEAGLK